MAVKLTKSVKYDEITAHLHIGQNMPGFLPESDVYCAPTLGDAIDVWEDMINSLDVEDGEEYSRILAVQSALRDKDIHRNALLELEKFKGTGTELANVLHFIHTPDQGADINLWISVHADSRDHCLIGQEQDGYPDVAVDEDGCEVEIIDEDAGDGTETEWFPDRSW
jgi:hypothetical protein